MASLPKGSDLGPTTLRVGLLGGWRGLDPWEAQDFSGVIVRNQCFETLYTRADRQIVSDPRYLEHPLRLDTVEASGFPRYEARLVEDLFFSDGSPVTPADVAESLKHVAPLRAMTTINAAGGRRVQFNALDKRVQIEPQLAQIWSVIGKRSDKGWWLGTGPYAIVHQNIAPEGHVLTLERNPHWNAGELAAPSIERIEFHAYPLTPMGASTRLRDALSDGEIDFTMMLPREVARGLQGVRKVYQPGQSTAFLAFTCKRAPLDDPAVRRALAMAIDPWALAQVCHDNPAAFAARGLLPPALAPTRRSLPRYGRDMAIDALSKCSKRPRQLNMLVVWGPRPYLPNPMGVARVICEQFSALGISVSTNQASGPEDFFTSVRRQEHDLVLSGYIAETPDPIDFLAALLSSTRIPKHGTPMASTTNLGGYADSEMDMLLSEAQADPSRVNSVNDRLEDLRPLVPLMYGASVAVHAWRVQDFEMDPRGIPSFRELRVD